MDTKRADDLAARAAQRRADLRSAAFEKNRTPTKPKLSLKISTKRPSVELSSPGIQTPSSSMPKTKKIFTSSSLQAESMEKVRVQLEKMAPQDESNDSAIGSELQEYKEYIDLMSRIDHELGDFLDTGDYDEEFESDFMSCFPFENEQQMADVS